MTENKGTQPTEVETADDEQDVEGHNMWISSTVSSDLARNHSKELEKAAKERNRAKEAKKG